MRGATGIGLLAVALVGVFACDKPPGDIGQTTTTSGETEQQRATREQEQKNLPGAVQEQEAAKNAEQAAADKAKAEADKAKAEADQAKAEADKKAAEAKKTAEAKKKAHVVKKTVIAKKVIKPKAKEKEEPTSTTTITEVEIETVPPRQQPMQPVEPGQQATPPGGMPLTTEATGTPYVNASTTLGNGTSGMYTGGQGTYGGRATWGTCCGVPAYPPVPQPYPPTGK